MNRLRPHGTFLSPIEQAGNPHRIFLFASRKRQSRAAYLPLSVRTHTAIVVYERLSYADELNPRIFSPFSPRTTGKPRLRGRAALRDTRYISKAIGVLEESNACQDRSVWVKTS
jgi:hypothetical protein